MNENERHERFLQVMRGFKNLDADFDFVWNLMESIHLSNQDIEQAVQAMEQALQFRVEGLSDRQINDLFSA